MTRGVSFILSSSKEMGTGMNFIICVGCKSLEPLLRSVAVRMLDDEYLMICIVRIMD